MFHFQDVAALKPALAAVHQRGGRKAPPSAAPID